MTMMPRCHPLGAAAPTTAAGLLSACGSGPEVTVPADGVPRGKISAWLHQTKAYDLVFTSPLQRHHVAGLTLGGVQE
ncbi:hypothetical protein MTP10_29180 [Nonomuraea sp. 3-1Str]|uniref:hypothetical protein n=1 Tax=Nonomuraea sp. 3-1Str TaxID=2929801 RepID=UPI002856A4C3|nr:hypothetical protein [Nonomuraea sp. 3-1Str]MDR8412791.1 hypothetical protein [Nonomuraea sp. 3-1Str]